MIVEDLGDAWELQKSTKYPLCITTNGITNKSGRAIMGRGIAYEAAQRYPQFALEFGGRLRAGGNHVKWFPAYNLITFPVKHHWAEVADLELIERSIGELSNLAQTWEMGDVYLPRPGCGNGGLRWREVRPVIYRSWKLNAWTLHILDSTSYV